MISAIIDTINFLRMKNPPKAYPRRFCDWLERPISGYRKLHLSDRFIGSKIDRAFNLLMDSEYFQLLLENCPEIEEIPVFLEPLKNKGGEYNSTHKQVSVNLLKNPFRQLQISPTKIASTIAHEYRHAYQYLKGLRGNTHLSVINDDPLLESFLAEADAVAFEARVCWEIGKKQTFNQQWRVFARQFPTVAKAFKKEFKQSKNLDNATSKALEAWFESPDLAAYYSKNNLESLGQQTGGKTPFQSAWERYWNENIHNWITPNSPLISSQPASAPKVAPQTNKKTQPNTTESPRIQFNAEGLAEKSIYRLMQHVPGSTYGKILKSRQELRDHFAHVDVHYAQIKDRNFSPF